MLNIFRQRQTLVKVVFGIILFLVAITMVITLIPGLTGDIGDTVNNPVVAEVAGERITEVEVQQSVQQIGARNRIPPEMMPFYTSQILNQMILEKASLNEADRLGLKVDEEELRAQLRQDQGLFPNGGFIGEQQYEELVSERFGVSVPQFEQKYRRAMLMDKLRQLVTDSVTVTPEEVHKAFLAENMKVVLDYVAVNPADFRKEINTGDNALQEYFKANKERYQLLEKRKAQILLVGRIGLRPSVTATDDELKKYYQEHLDSYRQQESVTVAHILVKADPKDPAQIEQAKKKAEDILKKAKAGGDFAALAKQYSEDKTTAPNGGVLSVARKQTVPEFEKVAFSLATGEISGPVQTMYGIHIIKGISHQQAHQQAFEEIKALIRPSVVEAKLDKMIPNIAEAASRELSKAPADIQAIADKYHVEVIAPPPFAQNESLPKLPSPNLMQEIFGLEKNHAGALVQLPDGYAIPVLLEVLPAHQAELADVKDQAKNDYVDEQARAKAMAKAKEVAKLLDEQEKDKKDLKKAAKSAGLTVKTSPPVGPDGTIPSLGNVKALDPKTFSMPVGATAGPIPIQGLQVVYQLESREPPSEPEFAGKKLPIEQKLLNDKRQLAFDIFQENLKKKLTASGDLKLHQDAVARLTSAAAPK